MSCWRLRNTTSLISKVTTPACSHVSRQTDNASVSSIAVIEADMTSNGGPPHNIVIGGQQPHAPPTLLLNSLTPTYSDKCFTEPKSQHEAPEGLPSLMLFSRIPSHLVLANPERPPGKLQKRIFLRTRREPKKQLLHESITKQYRTLYGGPHTPGIHHDRSHFELTAAENFEKASKNITQQMSAQGAASDARLYDVPQPSNMIPPSFLAIRR